MEITPITFGSSNIQAFEFDVDAGSFTSRAFIPDTLEVSDQGFLESGITPDSSDLLKIFDSSESRIDPETGVLLLEEIEAVIGDDDREVVNEPGKVPFSSIGRILMKYPKGLGNGTGTLVSPYHVLTCGHNISVRKYGGLIESLDFYAGFSENGLVSEKASATRIFVATKWLQEEDRAFDIALVELDKPIGNSAGYYGIAALEAHHLAGKDVTITGYPGDLDGGKNQYTQTDSIQAVTPFKFSYHIDTAKGQSGSSVMMVHQNSPICVGVHTSGHFVANGAIRITRQKFQTLISIIQA